MLSAINLIGLTKSPSLSPPPDKPTKAYRSDPPHPFIFGVLLEMFWK
jgi:hypothetical protein